MGSDGDSNDDDEPILNVPDLVQVDPSLSDEENQFRVLVFCRRMLAYCANNTNADLNRLCERFISSGKHLSRAFHPWNAFQRLFREDVEIRRLVITNEGDWANAFNDTSKQVSRLLSDPSLILS
jgi:hypothetical protein